MRWQLMLEDFGPNIQHIAGFDNIVADTLSIFPSTSSNNYDPFTRNYQCRTNDLFSIGRLVNNKGFFPLNILI